jgi:hypothetical protein
MNTIEIKSFKFHKTFVETYRGLDTIQTRRKLKRYYTRSEQDAIIRYLKENEIIKH